MKKKSFSVQETYNIAFALGEKAVLQFQSEQALLFVLQGELGAGKTTFAQGFAAGVGITDRIISPTFLIVKSYPVPFTERTLYHIDCYRLGNLQDLTELGWQEIMMNPQHIVLLEWPERVGGFFNVPKTEIIFETVGQEERELTIREA